MRHLACVHGGTWLEARAARELARYVHLITGSNPRVSRRARDGSDVLSVGRTGVVDRLVARGALIPPRLSGEEQFAIRSVSLDGSRYLLFLGAGPRAVLFAVYHYLERFCRVGFFWDGERVPAARDIPIEDIDVLEGPRWAERQYLLAVVYSYSTASWGWPEWRQEIDWAAKHRFNILTCPPGAVSVWNKVWRRFGVRVPPGSLSAPPYLMFASAHSWNMSPPFRPQFQRSVDRLTRRMLRYGRTLGFRWDSPAMAGIQVPREFAKAYEGQARFMDVRWAVFPPSKFIHPEDPLYAEVLKAFVREYRARYGTDHFWWLPSFFEMDLVEGRSEAEQLALKASIARKTLEAIRAVDPEAVLVCLGWTFAVRTFWPRDHVKAFLDALPEDAVRIWELWEDLLWPSKRIAVPLSEELDQYFGKPWLVGFLHSFGGTTGLHGNLAAVIRRVQQVATDRRAFNCRGMDMQMEAIHHNPLFYDLMSRLSWNPDAVRLDAFLTEYAERRYGREPAPRMVRCLEELAASVYSTADITSPLYQLRIEEPMLSLDFRYEREPCILSIGERAAFLPHLRRALEVALDEAGSLGGDALYQHDLIDIAKQYLGDLFNLRAVELLAPFRAGDLAAFDRAAAKLGAILESQEALLASSPWFHLEPELRRARRMWGAPRDFDARIRDIHTMWLDAIPDYARRDYYELVRHVYRPRVAALVSHMRERMAAGQRSTDAAIMLERYRTIERAFVAGRYARGTDPTRTLSPVEEARRVLEGHALEDA